MDGVIDMSWRKSRGPFTCCGRRAASDARIVIVWVRSSMTVSSPGMDLTGTGSVEPDKVGGSRKPEAEIGQLRRRGVEFAVPVGEVPQNSRRASVENHFQHQGAFFSPGRRADGPQAPRQRGQDPERAWRHLGIGMLVSIFGSC